MNSTAYFTIKASALTSITNIAKEIYVQEDIWLI